MSANSHIEWTDATWNPVTGCSKVSAGCKHCYAERMALRLRAMGSARYASGFNVALQRDLIELPLRWKTSRRVFVNSMSDLFHPEVPDEFISEVFDTVERASWHQFQVLTKRSERVRQMSDGLRWSPNLWLGVSVESMDVAHRLDDLRETGAVVKFVSFEPLLADVSDAPLVGLDWVIVGGESGPGARPIEAEWVRAIRDRCQDASVPFFFKQWGGVQKSRNGRLLDGRQWDEMPVVSDLPTIKNVTDTSVREHMRLLAARS